MKYIFNLSIMFLLGFGTRLCLAETNPKTLTYLGNAFVKLTTSEGKIIYIDPYAFTQTDSADIILITHEHSDHNDLSRVTPKTGCTIIRAADAIKDSLYQSFTVGNISITAVPAYNQYHPKFTGVGFIVEFDGIKIYHGGGTGKIPEMADFVSMNITYSLIPLTPGPELMTEAAAMIKAKRDIPMHTVVSLDSAYNQALVARFTSPNKLIVLPNKSIPLNPDAALHNGTMLLVPDQYSTIQSAINSAKNLDTVLVAEGIYKENIRYNGKNIYIASTFILTNNPKSILNTVIDGTKNSVRDTNSTIAFLNGEDSNAVLDGFTITGGSGTKYFFPFGTGSNAYQEGAGVILHYSAATIKNNIITGNVMKPVGSTQNGGGGGIAAMYSNPRIYNNVIYSNTAGYAGGIVLNWSAGKVMNNIIYLNKAVGQYGAGGIMVWESPKDSTIVENNTVVGNSSNYVNGGFRIRLASGTTVAPLVRNNLVWGNSQTSGKQIDNPQYALFCNVEDDNSRSNISLFPMLDSNFVLNDSSPCIDAGDSTGLNGDREDLFNLGFASSPSKGNLKNDIGAYGGQLAKTLPQILSQEMLLSTSACTLTGKVGNTGEVKIVLTNLSTSPLKIQNAIVNDTSLFCIKGNCSERTFNVLERDTLTLEYTPDTSGIFYDTIRIVYETPISNKSPFIITVKLTVQPTTGIDEMKTLPGEFRLYQNYPNPFNPSTLIRYQITSSGLVSLKIYDVLGREAGTLINDLIEAGEHAVTWNAQANASGIYFCVLESNNNKAVRKLVLIK